MKKSKLLLGLTLVGLLGIGVVSCDVDVVPPTPEIVEPGFLTELPAKNITLDEGAVIEAETSKYFTVYVARTVDGEISLVSDGGDTLVESGEKLSLYAYGVPEGYTLGVTVLNKLGEKTDDLTIGADGTFTAPEVAAREDFIIQLYAVSPNKDLTFDGKSYNRIIRKGVNFTVIPEGAKAKNDIYNYTNLDEKARTVGTATLESYAMKHGLTGTTLSSNGTFVLYNDRISSPLLDNNTYLPGYGWGTDLYGKINAPLAGEQTEAYKNFYHSHITPASDPGIINYLNSDLAIVSDLYTYISANYFYTPLNEDFSAYEYRGQLSRADKPIAVNPNADGTASKWKIPLRVGADADGANGATKGLTYRTNSKDAKLGAFDGTKVTLDDYLTTFKLLATKSIAWYRGGEQAAEKTATRQIKGFSEFYNSTGEATALPSNEEFSKQVGVSIDKSDNSITIEFNAPFSEEFAIYHTNSLWSNPMSESFIKTLGGGNVIEGAKMYGTSPAGKNIFDTSLSVGPNMPEYYENKKSIVFKKNDQWFQKKDAYNRDIYQIEGYHINVNSAIENDKNASMVAWENNKIDNASVTEDYWDQYTTDPRRKKVEGDRQQKFTYNTSDKVLWEKYWGEGGIWQQEFNPNNEYTWDTKPITSNRNFFKALNLGIDRVAYADKYHVTTSVDYFNPIAKVNPVTPNLYNESEEHKGVVKKHYGNTLDDLSKSPDYAVDYFDIAILEELEAGHYELGTEDKPTIVNLVVGSIDDVYYKDRLAIIAENWSNGFNKAVETHIDPYNDDNTNSWIGANNKPLIKFRLDSELVQNAVSQDELITKGLWTGRFDIQYAYLITGNAYDTLNGLDILGSNAMGGFELNFGVDTGVPSPEIVWEDQYFSFDGLWQATQGGVVLDRHGQKVATVMEPIDESLKVVELANGSLQFDFNTKTMEGFKAKLVDSNSVNYMTPTATGFAYKAAGTSIGVSDTEGTIIIPKDGLIPGSAVGGPEGSTYVQFIYEYEITSSTGKTAIYSATGSWLIS